MTAKELSWATALARAVDERMAVQHEHSWKVAQYCVAIADRLGWPERDLELLQMAAILHDVGKVSIPDHILRKQKPLSDPTGRRSARARCAAPRWFRASRVSRRSCRGSATRWSASTAPATPTGLSGEAIPLACRILHVADAFDAITSGRPYRAALEAGSDGGAARNAGHAVRPACVEALGRYLEESETAERPASPLRRRRAGRLAPPGSRQSGLSPC